MANVTNLLLSCILSNIVHLRRQVLLAHLNERELPELPHLLFVVRVQPHVRAAILGAARVTQPHIIASPCYLEGRRHIVGVHDPGVC